MGIPNFFCDSDAINFILMNQEYDGGSYIHFTMDVTHLPFYLSYTDDENNYMCKMYLRSWLSYHTSEEEFGSAVCSKAGGELQLAIGNEESDASIMETFYALFPKISTFIREKGLKEVYADLDPDFAGITLYVEADELKYKVVSGKKRPDLLCTVLFGTEMSRPYPDEFMDAVSHLGSDEETLEEKISQAEDGDEYYMGELADLYMKGDDETAADPEKAVYWNKKLAEAGSSVNMFNLGIYTMVGFGTKPDVEQAVYWMNKAAEEDEEGADIISVIFREIADSVDKAEAGDAQAQATLAKNYTLVSNAVVQGGAVESYSEAFRWAEKSAAQNCAEGIYILGNSYYFGRGVACDKKKAIELFKKGVELGSASCMVNLANEYQSGENIKKNKKKAFALLTEAAEKGNAVGMKALGRCYQYEIGCEYDMEKAIEWYEKSIEIIDDPELRLKVQMYKLLNSSHSEDVDEEDIEDEEGFDDMPDILKYSEIYEDAREYELELAEKGVLPDEPCNFQRTRNYIVSYWSEEYTRVLYMAEQGDSRAQELVSKMKAAEADDGETD